MRNGRLSSSLNISISDCGFVEIWESSSFPCDWLTGWVNWMFVHAIWWAPLIPQHTCDYGGHSKINRSGTRSYFYFYSLSLKKIHMDIWQQLGGRGGGNTRSKRWLNKVRQWKQLFFLLSASITESAVAFGSKNSPFRKQETLTTCDLEMNLELFVGWSGEVISDGGGLYIKATFHFETLSWRQLSLKWSINTNNCDLGRFY